MLEDKKTLIFLMRCCLLPNYIAVFNLFNLCNSNNKAYNKGIPLINADGFFLYKLDT